MTCTSSRPAAGRAPLAVLLLLAAAGIAHGTARTAPEQLRQIVDLLGDFDYAVRTEASRAVRRADPGVAQPVLRAAARGHEDSYVQFRALVLLYGFDAAAARGAFEDALGSANDRVRAAAYSYFENAPDPRLAPRLLAALDHETSEFVRPVLVRALAVHDDDEAVRVRLVRDIDRGESYFRAAVIEALGDRRAAYAVDPLIAIASEPGSLQDDALLALGKIGGGRAAAAVAASRWRAADGLQPVVSAAACLLGIDCDEQVRYVVGALRYGARNAADGNLPLLRQAASGLAALAARGHRAALDALLDVGLDADAPARAPVALAIGTVALRRPELVPAALAGRTTFEADLLLLRDAFDMLDEDMAEERFYAHLRRAYWEGADGSAARALAAATIRVLEF